MEIEAKFGGDAATMVEFCYFFVKRVVDLDSPQQRMLLAEEFADVLVRNLKVCEVTILGAGMYGAAASLPGFKVLKLTTDEGEADASSKLIGQRLTNVVSFYSAHRLEGKKVINTFLEQSGARNICVLTLERLDRIGLGKAAFDRTLGEIVDRVKGKYRLYPTELDSLDPRDYEMDMKRASLEIQEQLSVLGKPFNEIAHGLAELRSFEIYAVDVHSNNVGYRTRDRAYKIFDIGLSAAQGVSEIPTLKNPRKSS